MEKRSACSPWGGPHWSRGQILKKAATEVHTRVVHQWKNCGPWETPTLVRSSWERCHIAMDRAGTVSFEERGAEATEQTGIDHDPHTLTHPVP